MKPSQKQNRKSIFGNYYVLRSQEGTNGRRGTMKWWCLATRLAGGYPTPRATRQSDFEVKSQGLRELRCLVSSCPFSFPYLPSHLPLFFEGRSLIFTTLFYIYHLSEWLLLSLVDHLLLQTYPTRSTHSPSHNLDIDNRPGLTQMHVLLRTTSAFVPSLIFPVSFIFFRSYDAYLNGGGKSTEKMSSK